MAAEKRRYRRKRRVGMVAAMLVLVVTRWNGGDWQRIFIDLCLVSYIDHRCAMQMIEIWFEPAMKGKTKSDQKK
jgi:hypothetical protein